MKMRLNIAIVVITLLSLSAGAHAQTTTYYVYDGQTLNRVYGNPDTVSVKEWAAFYFRKGRPTLPPSARWGVDTESSVRQLLQLVKSRQKFENNYESWCRCEWGLDTSFNVVAPIAMLAPGAESNPTVVGSVVKFHNAWDKVQASMDLFNNAAELAGESKLPRLSSTPFLEYMHNMHRSIDQFMRINDDLTRYAFTASTQLDSAIDRFIRDSDLATRASPSAISAVRALRLDSNQTTSKSSSTSAGGGTQSGKTTGKVELNSKGNRTVNGKAGRLTGTLVMGQDAGSSSGATIQLFPFDSDGSQIAEELQSCVSNTPSDRDSDPSRCVRGTLSKFENTKPIADTSVQSPELHFAFSNLPTGSYLLYITAIRIYHDRMRDMVTYYYHYVGVAKIGSSTKEYSIPLVLEASYDGSTHWTRNKVLVDSLE